MGSKKNTPVTADSERPVPRRIEALQRAWEQFRSHLRVADRTLAQLDTDVTTASGYEYWGTKLADTVKSDEVTKAIDSMIEFVIREARIELAPPGAKLEIRREDVPFQPRYRQYHEPKDNLDELSLVEVFQSLAVQFGGGLAVERAATDAAKQLYDTFSHRGHWLGQTEPEKVKCWGDQCDEADLWQHATVWSYSLKDLPDGHNKYDHGVAETMHATLVALASMCAIRREDFVGSEAAAIACNTLGNERIFKYGQKIEVSSDLTLVCRKGKVEYKASRRLCQSIKDFVAINLFKPVTVPDDE